MANCQLGACHGTGGDLNSHRGLVEQLYVRQDISLKAVAESLRLDHGVIVSEIMLKKKLRQWRLRKPSSNRYPKTPVPLMGKMRSSSTEPPVSASLTALRRVLEEQIQVKLTPPTSLGLAEGVLYALRHYTSFRLKQERDSEASDLTTQQIGRDALNCFMMAADPQESYTTRVRGALLEKGFRTVERIVRSNPYVILNYLVLILVHLRLYKAAPAVARMLTTHVASIAAIIHRPLHPVAVFARNLQELNLTDDLLIVLLSANGDIHEETLGVWDRHASQTRDTASVRIFMLRKPTMTEDEIIAWHVSQVARYKGHPHELFCATIKMEEYADELVRFNRYGEAISLLEDAPDHIKIADDFYTARDSLGTKSIKATAPVSMISSLYRTVTLAKTITLLADEEFAKHDISDTEHRKQLDRSRDLYSYALSIAFRHFGFDGEMTQWTLGCYGKWLDALNLTQEARQIYAQLDESLSAYMLGNNISLGEPSSSNSSP